MFLLDTAEAIARPKPVATKFRRLNEKSKSELKMCSICLNYDEALLHTVQ